MKEDISPNASLKQVPRVVVCSIPRPGSSIRGASTLSGIDRIIAEAGVAKATFYKHFPSKDELVVAYIEEQDRLGRAAVAALPKHPPRDMIAAIMGRISEAVVAGGWRGCPFLNAAAEIPRPGKPGAAGHR